MSRARGGVTNGQYIDAYRPLATWPRGDGRPPIQCWHWPERSMLRKGELAESTQLDLDQQFDRQRDEVTKLAR
jgi:hypothetical protein